VWDDRILMITCGKTALIQALPEILAFIDKKSVKFILYERKCFMFQKNQAERFANETASLKKIFPGKSRRLGPSNNNHAHVFFSIHAPIKSEHDVTFQLMMYDLNPHAAHVFCSKNISGEAQVETLSGLSKIYPNVITDSYLFSPYGYSLNGIFKKNYYTVHVTPQPGDSYASFETNIKEKDYPGLIKKVISVFKPGKFSVMLTMGSDLQSDHLDETLFDVINNYDIVANSRYEFEYGVCAAFLNYVQINSNK
ncbi:MAG: hypothetical protein DRH56_09735, partial [Deltaproteobacteria bacterium]